VWAPFSRVLVSRVPPKGTAVLVPRDLGDADDTEKSTLVTPGFALTQ
jgi:hypothetical protein